MKDAVAILGASAIASSYVERLRALEGIFVKTVYSRTESQAMHFASTHGIPRWSSNLEQALDDPDLKAVIITCEPARHVELAFRAMEVGKHVLVEKPMSTDLRQASGLVERARTYGNVISVVSQRRFDPILEQMKNRLADFDQVSLVLAQLTMMWSRDQAYYEHGTGWRKRDSHVFLNQGIHWLDIINWFFGQVARVECMSKATRNFASCVDQTAALIQYENGATVNICGGTFCDRTYSDQFTIYHPRGRLDYAELASKAHGKDLFVGRVMRKLRGGKPTGPRDLLSLQVADFVRAFRENGPPTTNVEDGLRALSLALLLSETDCTISGDSY